MKVTWWVIAIVLQSCTIFYTKQEKQLRAFDKILQRYGSPPPIKCKEIWNQGKNKERLRTVIASNKTSKKGKFVAASVLLHLKQPIDSIYLPQVAQVYAKHLKHSARDRLSSTYYSLLGSHWGVLYTQRYINGKRATYSYAGRAGEQLIQIGKPAIPSLIKLLDDTNFYFFYEGSESTSNMDYQYRVKDFAAFFLSKITKVPWQFYLDKKKRDIEIERFKKELFKQLKK
jgi:hypothetical protein